MAEGWVRHYARLAGLKIEVGSAGIQKTHVKPEAIRVMGERGIDLGGHRSKTLEAFTHWENFDLVITVCDQAAAACPTLPAGTHRRHVSFPDPTGKSLAVWREVRDALERMSAFLVGCLARGQIPKAEALQRVAWPQGLDASHGSPVNAGVQSGTMEAIDPKITVNEIIAQNPEAVTVLAQLGIDTCCGGSEPLAKAAQEAGVSLEEVVAALEALKEAR